MKVVPVDCPKPFLTVPRGPNLQRWLWADDLQFAEARSDFAFEPKKIHGGIIEGGWVVFHKIQVIQIVPQEVHSYWHLAISEHGGNVVLVEESAWLTTFEPLHLKKCSHFVMEFLDDVVEMLCEDLLFGTGDFQIENAVAQYPCLGNAYFWRAKHREDVGDYSGAAADYRQVLELRRYVDFAESAAEHLRRLARQDI